MTPGLITEAMVERRLVRVVEQAGGRCLKWASGTPGAPDRIVLLPGGRVLWVECKRPGARPRPLQARLHDQLRALGQVVLVLDRVLDSVDQLTTPEDDYGR